MFCYINEGLLFIPTGKAPVAQAVEHYILTLYPEISCAAYRFNSFWKTAGFKIPESPALSTEEVMVRRYIAIVAVEIPAEKLGYHPLTP